MKLQDGLRGLTCPPGPTGLTGFWRVELVSLTAPALKINAFHNSKGAFTLRAVQRSKAAPVCAPSAQHGAARRRTASSVNAP